jgi:hypothetical protein
VCVVARSTWADTSTAQASTSQPSTEDATSPHGQATRDRGRAGEAAARPGRVGGQSVCALSRRSQSQSQSHALGLKDSGLRGSQSHRNGSALQAQRTITIGRQPVGSHLASRPPGVGGSHTDRNRGSAPSIATDTFKSQRLTMADVA